MSPETASCDVYWKGNQSMFSQCLTPTLISVGWVSHQLAFNVVQNRRMYDFFKFFFYGNHQKSISKDGFVRGFPLQTHRKLNKAEVIFTSNGFNGERTEKCLCCIQCHTQVSKSSHYILQWLKVTRLYIPCTVQGD